MRILITSSAMAGHARPLLPWAAAARDAGHDLLVVTPAAARETFTALDVSVVEGGSPDPDDAEELWSRFRSAGPEDASVIANREVFGRLHTEAMLPAVEETVARHRPHLLLHEPTEYAGPVVAVRTSTPTAQVAISAASVEHGSLALAALALRRHGPVVERLRAAPYLSRFPAEIDPSPYADTRRYREVSGSPHPLANRWDNLRDPLVYVTFGTVAGQLGAAPYRAAVEALADLPVRVLLTTGADLELGPVPPHVHVTRWVDQADVLAVASLVVCHGGSGTTLGALGAGVPLVVVPMFADQHHNAAAVQRLGAATVVESGGGTAQERADRTQHTVRDLRRAVLEMLADPDARDVARVLAARHRELPTPTSVIGELRSAGAGALRRPAAPPPGAGG